MHPRRRVLSVLRARADQAACDTADAMPAAAAAVRCNEARLHLCTCSRHWITLRGALHVPPWPIIVRMCADRSSWLAAQAVVAIVLQATCASQHQLLDCMNARHVDHSKDACGAQLRNFT
jgi:hypothetical protein